MYELNMYNNLRLLVDSPKLEHFVQNLNGRLGGKSRAARHRVMV